MISLSDYQFTEKRKQDCRWRGHMMYETINFGKKFKLFDEQWQPPNVEALTRLQNACIRRNAQ